MGALVGRSCSFYNGICAVDLSVIVNYKMLYAKANANSL